jgi:exopolyphosphatase/pppGpp-phosphohydrolase
MKPFVFIAFLMLAGCVSFAERIKEQKPVTPAMKAEIVKHIRENAKDPYSIRDAEISYGILHATGNTIQVCIRANGKNSFGSYIGRNSSLYELSHEGSVARFSEQNSFCLNPQISWQPFPEVYALRGL